MLAEFQPSGFAFFKPLFLSHIQRHAFITPVIEQYQPLSLWREFGEVEKSRKDSPLPGRQNKTRIYS